MQERFLPKDQGHLRAFTYGYLDIEDDQFDIDRKRIRTLRKLRKNCVILKPDKGQGIVLMKKEDYLSSLEKLFADKTKFRRLQKDPTLTRFSTLQSFIKSLLKRGEINEDQKKQMKPTAAQNGRAHGLQKIHKRYVDLPKFRPIIDTTNTPYCNIGKFLSNLLAPLTIKEYTVKDSFEAAQHTHQINP